MKIFELNKTYKIVCDAESTRYGFRHIAILMKNNVEIDKNKACYYNRTWESFPFQTVIHILLDKTTELTNKEKRRFKNKINKRR